MGRYNIIDLDGKVNSESNWNLGILTRKSKRTEIYKYKKMPILKCKVLVPKGKWIKKKKLRKKIMLQHINS